MAATSYFSPDGTTFTTSLATSAKQDLLSLQLTPGSLDDASTNAVTSPIIPDRQVIDRLGHMDPDIYALDDDSHLMRLLKVLLGGAGAGGLRKQIAIARLQNAFRGMHFLDLDRFYGALFGIRRTQAELMPDFGTLGKPAVFNPYTDAAGSDTWDDIHSRDASYRDRLIKFAKAIPLGGSYAGIRAAAEALFAADCEIYESWTWIDEQNLAALQPSVTINTYDSLAQAYSTWSGVAQANTWSGLDSSSVTPGGYFLGRTGQQNRSEVLIQPKRPVRTDELYEATRVLSRLAPTGAQIMIDPNGLAIHQPVSLRAVAASSEYWEVIYKTTPKPGLVDPAPNQPVYVENKPERCQPRPCFSRYQGETWCHNDDIRGTRSYRCDDDDNEFDQNDNDRINFSDGSSRDYSSSRSLMDGTKARGARLVSDGVMTSFAYAGRAYAVSAGHSSFARSYQ